MVDWSLELQMARSNAALLEAIETAKERARAAYDTGDRARSNDCLVNHLGTEQRLEVAAADHYHCPRCGHCLKRRDGGRCPIRRKSDDET